MKQTFYLSSFLILSIVSCLFIQQDVTKKRDQLLKKNYMAYTMPSDIVGLGAMEFKGIVSDFLFLKVSTFFGGEFEKKEIPRSEQAEFVYDTIDVITDLDPWFWDAYLFSDMVLTWDFGKVDKANSLLFKARKYRTEDFKVPYYIGFNYFYFLKDQDSGSKFLMEASKLPGSPSFLPALATRLSMYQNQYGPAITFLNDILKTTQSPELKKQLEIRLKTLMIMDSLEKNVRKFETKFGVFPDHLSDLTSKGLVESIPDDPYGGTFILLKNKRVYTTSKMIYKK